MPKSLMDLAPWGNLPQLPFCQQVPPKEWSSMAYDWFLYYKENYEEQHI